MVIGSILRHQCLGKRKALGPNMLIIRFGNVSRIESKILCYLLQ